MRRGKLLAAILAAVAVGSMTACTQPPDYSARCKDSAFSDGITGSIKVANMTFALNNSDWCWSGPSANNRLVVSQVNSRDIGTVDARDIYPDDTLANIGPRWASMHAPGNGTPDDHYQRVTSLGVEDDKGKVKDHPIKSLTVSGDRVTAYTWWQEVSRGKGKKADKISGYDIIVVRDANHDGKPQEGEVLLISTVHHSLNVTGDGSNKQPDIHGRIAADLLGALKAGSTPSTK